MINDSYHSKQGEIVKRGLAGENQILVSGRGFGKALSLDTQICVNRSQWTTFRDIAVGDKVFHPDGELVYVVAVSEVMYNHTVYLLEFDDGSKIKADAGHLWSVYCNFLGQMAVITTEWMHDIFHFKQATDLKLYANIFEEQTKTLVAITEIPSEPVRCITVSSPDGLFVVTRDSITTHNSVSARGIIYLSAINYQGYVPPQNVTKLFNAIAMPTLVQAKKIHWEPLEYLFTETPLKRLRKNIDRSQGIITLIGNKPGILLSGINEDNGDKLRGLSIPRLVIDEFQDVKPGIWTAIAPAVNRCRGSIFISLTPKGKGTPVHRFVTEMQAKGWQYYHYHTSDNPKLPDIDKILADAKESLTPREYRQEILASWEDFPGQIFDQIIDETHIKPLSLNPSDYDFCVMGLDWGDVNPALSIVGIKIIDNRYHYHLLESWEGNPDGGSRTVLFDDFKDVITKYAYKYNIHSTYPDVFQPGNISYIQELRRIDHPGLRRCPDPNGYDYAEMRKLKVMPSCSLLNRLFYQDRLFLNADLQIQKDDPHKLAEMLGYELGKKLISPIDQIKSFRRKKDKCNDIFLDEPDATARKHIIDTFRYPVANIENAIAGMNVAP